MIRGNVDFPNIKNLISRPTKMRNRNKYYFMLKYTETPFDFWALVEWAAVRIQASEKNYIEHLFTVNCVLKRREKDTGIAHLKNCFPKNGVFLLFLIWKNLDVPNFLQRLTCNIEPKTE